MSGLTRVRGRVRAIVGGVTYTVELTMSGITVRRLHARKCYNLSLKKVVNLSKPQPELFHDLDTGQ